MTVRDLLNVARGKKKKKVKTFQCAKNSVFKLHTFILM